jgi:SAM-dependent methyltransferase
MLVDPEGPDLPGGFLVAASLFQDWRKVAEGYRNGKGVGWHEHSAELFRGTERFFRPGYAMNLVPHWLPALKGVVPKLERGARVADIGCGHGASTIVMAKAYPKSEFFGFDYHPESISAANDAAQAARVGGRVHFEISSAADFPGENYDLVACFDCLHDMGDPAAAATHIHKTLAKDGTWLIVEPFSNASLPENLNPVGRVFYSASAQVCIPASIAQGGKVALGAQASDEQIERIATRAGFGSFRRATETPFNRVFEARP